METMEVWNCSFSRVWRRQFHWATLRPPAKEGFPNANIYFINLGLDIITMIIPRK